jgi:D-glycero-alpha-D-manno-heptose-7-phosphate kinase
MPGSSSSLSAEVDRSARANGDPRVNRRPTGRDGAHHLVRAKAPLRLSFAGGGTDVPPFPAEQGGVVLNATINRHAYATLRPRQDDQIELESLDFGLALRCRAGDGLIFDGQLDLLKAAIRKMWDPAGGGFDLFVHSSAPPGSGLGLSSTVMVTVIGLLMEYQRIPLTDYEIAEHAYVLEREDLGLRGGLQDQYAATFGGFNFIEFHGDRVVVNPLRIKPETVNELEHNLLLCYTGATHVSDGIIADQTMRFIGGEADTVDALKLQKELATEMKNALLRGRLGTFAELLGEAWRQKKRMSPRIATSFIDEAYEEALKHGAVSGKVTGAGGGGYMLFYCDYRRKHRVAEALTRMGASVADFGFEFNGLTTWRATGG